MNDTALINAALKQLDAIADAAEYAKSHRREFAPGTEHSNQEWYSWQKEGFEAPEGQVMTMAGNQTGKTWSSAYHFATDITGDYPADWKGFQFDHQMDTTVLGVDADQLKDVTQKELFGTLDHKTGKFTGGWVHPDEIEHVERSQVRGLAKTVYVTSRFGTSKVDLRAYTQAATGQATLKFAGTKKDLIWPDECPPDELVGQLIMRLANGNMGRGGRIRYTMTPELGQTNLVTKFMEEPDRGQQRLIGPVDWDDCPHMTPDKQALLLAGIPEHEHEMRKTGLPFFGSGLIFPIADSRIEIEPFDLSQKTWYLRLRSVDLGIDHPTAIVWLAYDPETETVYLVKDYSVSGESVAVHANAANSMWPGTPIVFPPDVDSREKGSGRTVRTYWEENGIPSGLGVDFANPDGSRYVEPGIMVMLNMMRNGTFKVFKGQCPNFMKEKRMYHRKDGKRIDKNNDVIDATRYGVMTVREHGVTSEAMAYHQRPNVIKAHRG